MMSFEKQIRLSIANSTQVGFTLMELLIIVSIAALLLTTALPSFRDFVVTNRQVSAINEFLSTLRYARSEAVSRTRTISICASNDQTACSGNNNWELGWIAFEDIDSDGVLDGGDTPLLVGQDISDTFGLRAIIFDDTDVMRFSAQGTADSVGSFLLCDNRGSNDIRVINVNAVGQARVATDQRDVNGAATACL